MTLNKKNIYNVKLYLNLTKKHSRQKMKEVERYPDPNQFDESLYKNLLRLPCGNDLDLAWLKNHVWKQVDMNCLVY